MVIAVLFGGKGKRMRQAKAFLEIDGVPAWQFMRDQLAPLTTSDILMVVPKNSQPMEGVIQLESHEGYLRDLVQVIQQKPDFESLLVVNGDALLIETSDIRQFLDQIKGIDADFIWPAIKRECLPKERRSGLVTNYLPGTMFKHARGQVMFFGPNFNLSSTTELENLDNNKISGFLKMIWSVNSLKILLCCHQLPDWEKHFEAKFGIKTALPECEIPNLAIDVDTRTELEYIEKVLEERKKL